MQCWLKDETLAPPGFLVVNGLGPMVAIALLMFPLLLVACAAQAQDTVPLTGASPDQAIPAPAPEQGGLSVDPAALEDIKFPGIEMDLDNHVVDVEATVCLDAGLLELIACIPDSKEHESLVVTDAAPMHIHAALLLMGAINGNPATARPANEERTRWIHLQPAGDPIAVSLVIPGEEEGTFVELPISDFIQRAQPHVDGPDPLIPQDPPRPGDEDEDERDPAEVFRTFVFAGSQIVADREGNRRYLADHNGNIISISTFGDELLCLPFIESKENGELDWQANNEALPRVGTRVTLRLRVIQNQDNEAEE